jgi:formamidopyrimidine-DNA glycosylase
VAGQTIRAVERRAKYIVVHLPDDVLLIHLKMTGRLYVCPDDTLDHADQWVHVRFQLDNGHQLRFSDSRKFGKVYLTDDLNTITGKLGVEPLSAEFTPQAFAHMLQGRTRALKPLLLDQSHVVGVGNIYADEALFRAGLHPLQPANTLTTAQTVALHEAIIHVLQTGIQHNGASVDWYRRADGTKGQMQNHLNIYDRADEPCYTCGSPIRKIRVAQRGTHYCPNCQALHEGSLDEPNL